MDADLEGVTSKYQQPLVTATPDSVSPALPYAVEKICKTQKERTTKSKMQHKVMGLGFYGERSSKEAVAIAWTRHDTAHRCPRAEQSQQALR